MFLVSISFYHVKNLTLSNNMKLCNLYFFFYQFLQSKNGFFYIILSLLLITTITFWRWFLGYTCCDACGRLFVKGNYCPVCLKVTLFIYFLNIYCYKLTDSVFLYQLIHRCIETLNLHLWFVVMSVKDGCIVIVMELGFLSTFLWYLIISIALCI